MLVPIDGGQRCQATYMVQTDLKGGLPGWAVKQVRDEERDGRGMREGRERDERGTRESLEREIEREREGEGEKERRFLVCSV